MRLNQKDLPALYHLNGQRFSADGEKDTDWLYHLQEAEQGLGPMGIMKKYLFGTLPDAISKPETWTESLLSELH